MIRRYEPQPVDIIEAVIGPQVRGNPRALATSIAGALKSAALAFSLSQQLTAAAARVDWCRGEP